MVHANRIRAACVGLTALVGAGALTTACSSSPPASLHSGSAVESIRTNWTSFFSGKTSAARKIELVENGHSFAGVIDAEANSELAKGASAQVLSVVVNGDSATVRYTIDLDGAAALRNQRGEAVRTGGVWRVAAASFCVLLDLEQTKTAACPAGSTSGT